MHPCQWSALESPANYYQRGKREWLYQVRRLRCSSFFFCKFEIRTAALFGPRNKWTVTCDSLLFLDPQNLRKFFPCPFKNFPCCSSSALRFFVSAGLADTLVAFGFLSMKGILGKLLLSHSGSLLKSVWVQNKSETLENPFSVSWWSKCCVHLYSSSSQKFSLPRVTWMFDRATFPYSSGG